MRFFLAAAVLSACTAFAQLDNTDETWDDESDIQARDAARGPAHGGQVYRGFEEMAHHYPGHPLKAHGAKHGAKHHARSDEGEDESWLDQASEYVENVARAVKGQPSRPGGKGPAKHPNHKPGNLPGGQRGGPRGNVNQHWARDAEDLDDEVDEEGDDIDYEDDESASTLAARGEPEDEEIDWNPETRYENEDAPVLSARDVSEDDEIDWNPETRYTDDFEASPLSARDLLDDDEDSGEPDAASEAIINDTEEDIADPKLELESEFDAGVQERDVEPEDDDDDDEFEALKAGMKHMFARDAGVDPAGINFDDVDFLSDEDVEEDLEKRSMPQGVKNPAHTRPLHVPNHAAHPTKAPHKPQPGKGPKHAHPTKGSWWPW